MTVALARVGVVAIGWLTLISLFSVFTRGRFTWEVLATGSAPVDPNLPDAFNSRYAAHPWWTLVHVVCGFLFMVTGPWQFVPSIRNRWRALHRVLGRVFVFSAVVESLTALAFVAVLPVYGAFASSVASALGACLMLGFVARAVHAARRRRFLDHREWMIRSYALGLGIGTFRFLLPLFMLPPFSASFVESWDTVVWMGFILNLLVAEMWINLTRATPRLSPPSRSTAAGASELAAPAISN